MCLICSCDMWDLVVVICELLVTPCGMQFPDQGLIGAYCIGSLSLSHWTARESLFTLFLDSVPYRLLQSIE